MNLCYNTELSNIFWRKWREMLTAALTAWILQWAAVLHLLNWRPMNALECWIICSFRRNLKIWNHCKNDCIKRRNRKKYQVFHQHITLAETILQNSVNILIRQKMKPLNVWGTIDVQRHIRMNILFNGKVACKTREHSYDNFTTELIRHRIEFIKASEFGSAILEIHDILIFTKGNNWKKNNKIRRKKTFWFWREGLYVWSSNSTIWALWRIL